MTAMKVLSVAIDSLQPDPANARKHDQKNLDAIAGSLRTFGQVRPLIVWGDIVIAGNGTLQAAKSLGWTDIQITRVPKEWTHEQARAYALADNRTAELAAWDDKLLADQLVELDSVGWEISDFGFAPLQPPTDPETPDTSPQLPDVKYAVIIDCNDEFQQFDLLERLAAEGLHVRPLAL